VRDSIKKMRDDSLTAKLSLAAEKTVGAPVTFDKSTPIVETSGGQLVWEGVVSEFLTTSKVRVYAWRVESAKGTQFIAVIHNPRTDSALAAVREWLVSESKK